MICFSKHYFRHVKKLLELSINIAVVGYSNKQDRYMSPSFLVSLNDCICVNDDLFQHIFSGE